jgi:hypothetical protein
MTVSTVMTMTIAASTTTTRTGFPGRRAYRIDCVSLHSDCTGQPPGTGCNKTTLIHTRLNVAREMLVLPLDTRAARHASSPIFGRLYHVTSRITLFFSNAAATGIFAGPSRAPR